MNENRSLDRAKWIRLTLLLAVGAAIIAFFVLGGREYLSLDFLKSKREELEAMKRESSVSFIVGFASVYIVTVALSIPGAAVLTLAAGAFFGFVAGTIIVSISSTVGATLAFLSARFIFGDWVRSRFEEKFRAVNEGMKKDGAYYLMTLRLVPIFPFFLVNLVMALTQVRTWTYFWASFVGMLPPTMVYVNAGTQLGKIESLRGLLSPQLIASFLLLAAFPYFARYVSRYLRRP